MPDSDASGQVGVVTGAGSGIGQALALLLASHGWRVALLDLDDRALAETTNLVPDSEQRVLAVRGNVADWTSVAGCVVDVQARFGRVDAVFCLAGVIHAGDVLITDSTDFEHVLRVNTVGSFNTAKAFLPQLLSSEGKLIFVSSAFGLVAAPNYAAYCASKFAVRALAETLEAELAGSGVTVSCVYAGGVKTGIMRHGRYADGVDQAAIQETFDKRIARTTPEDAAAQILAGVRRGRRRIYVGNDARAVAMFVRLFGGFAPRLVERVAHARRK